MKFLLSLISCVVIAYGCKPIDHSESEEKGLGTLFKQGAKKLTKAGKLSDEVATSIQKLAKTDDQTGIDNMKRILKQGGAEADEAALAYRRAYDAEILKWNEKMTYLRSRHDLWEELQPLNQEDTLVDLAKLSKTRKEIRDHLGKLDELINRRSNQIEKMVTAKSPTKQMNQLTGAADRHGLMFNFNAKGELIFPRQMRENKIFLTNLSAGKATSKHSRLTKADIKRPYIDENLLSSFEGIKKGLHKEHLIHDTVAKQLVAQGL